MLRDPDEALTRLAILAEPIRRSLYQFILASPQAVGRDAAAAAVGIGRPLAAFHLDRLVEAGFLETEFRRLGGRSGPGAGRTSKLYRASRGEAMAAIPPRRYDVAADLFATALGGSPGGQAMLGDLARDQGRVLGLEARRRAGLRAGERARLDAVRGVLRDAGYAPVDAEDEIRLLNCPFDAVAQHHREVMCGTNLALIGGVLEGARVSRSSAQLDFRPGLCCVAIREAPDHGRSTKTDLSNVAPSA